MRSNASRRPSRILAFVLALPLLSGCAIDKGTALAAKFEKDWAGTADIAEVRVNGYNILPFGGKAIGVLVFDDGTSAERVIARARDLREYVARNVSITGRITADGITVTVDPDERRTREILDLWRSLTADERVVDGDIESWTSKNVHHWRSKVTTVDSGAAMAVFDDMVGNSGPHRLPSDLTSVEVVTRAGANPAISVRSDADGRLPTEAVAAYEAVRAEYPVVGATLHTTSVRIVVAGAADLEDIRELARRAAPGLGADAVSVTSRGGA
ncbi:hypothetical protein ACH474_24685 [Nocardia rhamnosiphila]|uniref:hypothetical protein n=1 Tax=Nocardia rhamnosiphila TaxID=426716 RepID=UPI003793692B